MNKLENLEIIDTVVGNSENEVEVGDVVIMEYVGKLYGTDKQFDESKNFQTQIGVRRVIEGWDVGILGMKVGGERILNIPSRMAYGENGVGNVIPSNSDLTFNVKLNQAWRALV